MNKYYKIWLGLCFTLLSCGGDSPEPGSTTIDYERDSFGNVISAKGLVRVFDQEVIPFQDLYVKKMWEQVVDWVNKDNYRFAANVLIPLINEKAFGEKYAAQAKAVSDSLLESLPLPEIEYEPLTITQLTNVVEEYFMGYQSQGASLEWKNREFGIYFKILSKDYRGAKIWIDRSLAENKYSGECAVAMEQLSKKLSGE